MNTYKLARALMLSCGVKIEDENVCYLYIMNKHGLRDRIKNTEKDIISYIFSE